MLLLKYNIYILTVSFELNLFEMMIAICKLLQISQNIQHMDTDYQSLKHLY